MKTENQTVIDFDSVCYSAKDEHSSGIVDMTLSIVTGRVVVIAGDDAGVENVICDLAEGLQEPVNGSVSFCGTEWRMMSNDSQLSARGMIGRVFSGHGWISNLNVYDNVTLSARHHSLIDDALLREQVLRMCEAFGIAATLEVSSETLPAGVLRKLEWVRAFLGERKVVILERPEYGVKSGEIAALINCVNRFVDAGGAVLWFAGDGTAAGDRLLKNVQRYRLEGGRVKPWMEVQRNAKAV